MSFKGFSRFLSPNFYRLRSVSSPFSAAELGPRSNLDRLNKAMKSIGRSVKCSAAAAVERIGAGIQGKVRNDGRMSGVVFLGLGNC